MANNYQIQVRAVLDKADLQSQLNNLSQSGNGIEIKANLSSQSFQQIQNELNSISSTPIDVDIDSRDIGDLGDLTQRVIKDGKVVSETYKKVGDDVDVITKRMGNTVTSTKKFHTESDKASKAVRGFGDDLKTAYEKFAVWSIATVTWYGVVRAVKDVVSQVIELDSSLVELQKVTDLTGNSLDSFTEKAFEVGQAVGRTGKEVIDATTVFARSGYEIQDALNLSEVALVMTNVGDGISNVEEAATSLISVLKAYGIEASNASQVTDIINEVSNNAAINFADLTEGITRAGAVFAQSGTSLEELTGLLTGANEIMQNIEKSSSGLITISQRLRGITELSDDGYTGVSNLSKEFKRLAGIDIYDAEGQLRDTYDILEDMARVFPTLNKNTQQYLGELAAGKRQINVLQSVLSNWESVEGAVQSATNSVGSAEAENEKFLNSIQGKLNQLSNAWQELALKTVSSDFVKGLVDIGTLLVNITASAGGLIPIAGTLLGILVAINATKISKFFTETWKSLKLAANGFKAAAAGALTLQSALGVVGLVMAGISVLFSVMTAIDDAIDSTEESIEKLEESISETLNKTASTIDEFTKTLTDAGISLEEINKLLEGDSSKSYEELVSQAKNLSAEEKNRLNLIYAQIEANKILAQKEYEERSKLTQKDESRSRTDTFWDTYSELRKFNFGVDASEIAIEEASVAELTRMYRNLNSVTATSLEQQEKNKEYKAQIINKLSEEGEYLNNLKDQGIEINAVDEERLHMINSVIDSYTGQSEAIADVIEETNSLSSLSLDDLNSQIDGLQNAYKTLSSAVSEYNENGVISIDTLQNIIGLGAEYIGLLQTENGQLTINEQSMSNLVDALKAQAIYSLQAAAANDIMALSEGRLNDLSLTAVSALGNIGSGLMGVYDNANLSADALANFNQQVATLSGGSLDISSISREQEAILNAYRSSAEQIANMSVGMDNLSSSTNSAANAASKLKSELSGAKSSIDDLLSMAISMLKQYYSDLKDEQKKALEDQIDALEKLRDTTVKNIELELDGIKKRISAEKELLKLKDEERSYEKELAEKQKEISDAESRLIELRLDDSIEAQKERLQLEEELSKKKSDLEDFQYDRSKTLQENALDDEQKRYEEIYKTRIDGIEAEYDARIDSLKAQLDYVNSTTQSEYEIRTEAIALIEGRSGEFYNRLIEWNRMYGDGIDTSVVGAWDDAYLALDKYGINQIGVLGVLNNLVTQMNNFKEATDNATGAASSLNKELGGTGRGTPVSKILNATRYSGSTTHISSSGTVHGGSSGTYHDGIDKGFVGYDNSSSSDGDIVGANIKPDERIIKAFKGELVVTPQQQLDFIQKGLPKIVARSSENSGFSFDKMIEINVEGSLDEKVVPQIMTQINQALSSRGLIRKANQFA